MLALEPEVSVVCITYNQAQTVEQSIGCIVHQHTSFPFEVIVHDDCSTDGTDAIVKRCAIKYGEALVPILEEENQYLLGRGGISQRMVSLARGKYVAFCEGDDYWSDPGKLQRQYDFLEAHPDYFACIHNADVLDAATGLAYESEPDSGDKDKSIEELIREGGGKMNPTASFFFRNELPDSWPTGPVGDHFYLILFASKGKVRWMSKSMSVYRYRWQDSWTRRNSNKGKGDRADYYECYIASLTAWDELTNGAYHEAFVERIALERHSAAYDKARYSSIGALLRCGEIVWSDKLKALVRKLLPERLYWEFKRLSLLRSARKSGTLVASSLSAYSHNCWAMGEGENP